MKASQETTKKPFKVIHEETGILLAQGETIDNEEKIALLRDFFNAIGLSTEDIGNNKEGEEKNGIWLHDVLKINREKIEALAEGKLFSVQASEAA